MSDIYSHTHLENNNPVKVLDMVDHFGYEKYCVLGIPPYSNSSNTLE